MAGNPEYSIGVVGSEETTPMRTKYRDLNNPTTVWWDMAGTGGINQREWTYYNDLNLGAYNNLLVLHDGPFSRVSNIRHWTSGGAKVSG